MATSIITLSAHVHALLRRATQLDARMPSANADIFRTELQSQIEDLDRWLATYETAAERTWPGIVTDHK